jgi:predicted Zn-dependent protease
MKIDPSFAEEIISEAVKSGAEQAEVFIKSYKNLTVDIKDQEVDSLTSSLSYGYGLRVIRNNVPACLCTDIKEKIQS